MREALAEPRPGGPHPQAHVRCDEVFRRHADLKAREFRPYRLVHLRQGLALVPAPGELAEELSAGGRSTCSRTLASPAVAFPRVAGLRRERQLLHVLLDLGLREDECVQQKGITNSHEASVHGSLSSPEYSRFPPFPYINDPAAPYSN